MEKLSYSVVIRTLGNTGEKYNALLQSIKKQTIKPDEIIVVIPNGYTLDYQLGIERIIRSPKGMISQRACGIMEAKSDYILVVDDDLEFSATLVEELYDYLSLNHLDVCFPMEGVESTEEKEKSKMIFQWKLSILMRSFFTGQMFISKRKSKFLDIITPTAGHKVFIKDKYKDGLYFCQTGNFQIHFIKTELAKRVQLENEKWLETGTISRYSAYDDPVYYYKLYLMGATMAYSLRTRYKHLDAGAGRIAHSKVEEKRIRYYTVAKNRTIFWKKFIWDYTSTIKKPFVLICGLYGMINYFMFSVLVSAYPKMWSAIQALCEGYKHAITYLLFHKIGDKSI